MQQSHIVILVVVIAIILAIMWHNRKRSGDQTVGYGNMPAMVKVSYYTSNVTDMPDTPDPSDDTDTSNLRPIAIRQMVYPTKKEELFAYNNGDDGYAAF